MKLSKGLRSLALLALPVGAIAIAATMSSDSNASVAVPVTAVEAAPGNMAVSKLTIRPNWRFQRLYPGTVPHRSYPWRHQRLVHYKYYPGRLHRLYPYRVVHHRLYPYRVQRVIHYRPWRVQRVIHFRPYRVQRVIHFRPWRVTRAISYRQFVLRNRGLQNRLR